MRRRPSEISRVLRPRSEARANYDRLSPWYDLVSSPFERKARDQGLELLDIRLGESVLEVGFGTGWALLALARSVGASGRVYGIDQSAGMLRLARDRIERGEQADRIELVLADAVALPYSAGAFDCVFTCFTLELFDTPDIAAVVSECGRVLRPGGRIGVVSLAKSSAPGTLEQIYERLHAAFPIAFDCRPIHVSKSLSSGGFELASERAGNLWGLPVAIVLASKYSPL